MDKENSIPKHVPFDLRIYEDDLTLGEGELSRMDQYILVNSINATNNIYFTGLVRKKLPRELM